MPRYVRPILIGSVIICVFALLIQDWLIAAVMAST
jgi:lipopolysaccharide export LptBFGC system permease protein LptF